MHTIPHNLNRSSEGFDAIVSQILRDKHHTVFLTWIDYTGKTTLAEGLAAKLNGDKTKHKKVAIHYQSEIAEEFLIPLDDKAWLSQKQQEIMMARYDKEIEKDQQTKDPVVIYDRSILDLVWVWSSYTNQSLEYYEEVIVWYLKHYPNFCYIITTANKETILKRAQTRENRSESDIKLINDLKSNDGKEIYEENMRKNKELGEYIQKLIDAWTLTGEIMYVDTSS
jgi:thymidylate kinase